MGREPATEPTGPIVVLARDGPSFSVCVAPPLPSGDHRAIFDTKNAAWAGASALWTRFRLGLRDETDQLVGNTNARRKQSNENSPSN